MIAMRSLRRLAGAALATCCCAASLAACGGSKTSTGPSATTGTTAGSGSTQTGSTGNSTSGGVSGGSASGGSSTSGGATGAAGSREVAPGTVRAASGGIVATLHAGTHKPRVNANWTISFAVRANGKAAKATVEYEYLFGGAVVARRSHYSFTGSFHDVFNWPSSAVGYPLTFRAAIKSEGATLNLDYPVQVVR